LRLLDANTGNMKTFRFNTGVRPYSFSPPVHVMKGNIVDGNGVMQIPFDCEDVPDNAVFEFACDHTPPGSEHLLRREMHNTNMVSKYAFFRIPK